MPSPATTYRARVVDAEVEAGLSALGAVAIEGPRACGKTWTATRSSRSAVRLDDPGIAELAAIDPAAVLDGATPRLIDEWQLVPTLWNAVRRAVDDRQSPGQFILTGSAVLPPDSTRHSGAGRMVRVRMRPMSLWESGESTGEVSIGDLFDGEPQRGHADHSPLATLAPAVRGGWPALVGTDVPAAARFVRGYIDAIVEHDLVQVDTRRRDPLRFRRFLEAYAQVGAQTASLATIAARASGADVPPDGAGLTWATADTYLDLARRLMIVDEVPAWNTHLRSRTRLTQAAKRCLCDPSLMVALLGADADRLRGDPETLGFVFESLVIRDLRTYAQAHDADLFHYRERSGDLEVDLVVERRDGTWIGVEVKLGSHRIDEAARALRTLADRRVTRPPAALVVVTGSGYAYRRPDGVDVVPLTTLRP